VKLTVNYGITMFIKGRLANTAHELQIKYMVLLYCTFNRLHKQWIVNKLCIFRYDQWAVWFW